MGDEKGGKTQRKSGPELEVVQVGEARDEGKGGRDAPSTSTKRCIASRYASSLSFESTQMQKKRPAYRLEQGARRGGISFPRRRRVDKGLGQSAPVHDLVVSELNESQQETAQVSFGSESWKEDDTDLDKVGLVLLISRCDQTMDLPA